MSRPLCSSPIDRTRRDPVLFDPSEVRPGRSATRAGGGRDLVVRWLGLVLTCGLCLGVASVTPGADEPAQSPLEVNAWSVWVGNPAQATINASRVYRNAMPGVIGTVRPKFDEKELAGKFPVDPVSVVQFFGEPCRDIDVELRMKKGTFLAHWPPSTERGGRLQWFKADLSSAPPAGIPPGYLPETHWFQTLRQVEPALFLKHESRFERFLAYDTELSTPIPLKLRGGPDEYTLQNLTDRRLLDVAVIAPTDHGYRVGWLDELPAATSEKDEAAKSKKETAKEPEKDAARKKSDAQKAETLFQDAEAKAKEPAESKKKEDEPRPLPPEGDATVRARVDQVLNRPINVTVEEAPRKEVLDLVAGQARLRYELDERTIARAEINLGQPMSLKVGSIAARDALAEVLGNAGLSYRVTEDGTLFITTAARLADEAGKQGRPIEGPPVKLVMSQPFKPADPSYREMTRDALTRRLAGQGLRESVVKLIVDRYGQALFEPGELIVLAHLAPESIDDLVTLDVFPPPRKLVRTALLVVHGVDPRLQDRARSLVQQLGDDSPRARDSAEARLLELGPVAVPVLEDALTDKDVEIVFRAERLLLRLNRPVP